jgi:hypothetical protein
MATSHSKLKDSARADRRRAVRVNEAQGETVLVRVEGQPPQAAVFLDESPYGIGVALPHAVRLAIGQRVEVVFRGTAQAGVVSSLRGYSDVIRVGVEWTEACEQMGA